MIGNIQKFHLNAVVILFIISGIGLYMLFTAYSGRFCFYNHLTDAVRLNQSRRNYYAEKTGGISGKTSDMLIRNESLMIIPAFIIDLRAQKFIGRGIPVVCNDFVDMDTVKNRESPPVYKSAADSRIFSELSSVMKLESAAMKKFNTDSDFLKISGAAYKLLTAAENTEIKSDSSFCMTKHVIESLGLGSLHASVYFRKYGSGISPLIRSFLDIQISGISDEMLSIDREAQKSHNLNTGIVCNDVPAIPFKQEYEKYMADSR